MVGMLYDRRHTRAISEFGGLKTVMPWFAALFLLVCLSSIAVPGFNGFVGEFLILIGSWSLQPARWSCWRRWASILAAAYILWMVQRVLYGEVTNDEEPVAFPTSRAREVAVLLPLVVAGPRSWGWPARSSRASSSPSVQTPGAAETSARQAPASRGAAAAAARRARRRRRREADDDAGDLDLRPLFPALVVAVTGVVVLLAQAFTPKGGRPPRPARSLAGLAGALAAVLVIASGRGRGAVHRRHVAADDFALFFHVLILAIGDRGRAALARPTCAQRPRPRGVLRAGAVLDRGDAGPRVLRCELVVALRGPRDHVGRGLRAWRGCTATARRARRRPSSTSSPAPSPPPSSSTAWRCSTALTGQHVAGPHRGSPWAVAPPRPRRDPGAASGAGASSWSASASRWRACPSTCGRPTSTRARPPR